MAKILFIQGLLMEQLGVMGLSAVLKAAGHETRLAAGSDDHIMSVARSFKPDIVGTTALTGFQERWSRLADALKKSLHPAPLVVFGGPHATFFPEIALRDSIDAACRGEGEGPIAEIAEAIDGNRSDSANLSKLLGKIANICYCPDKTPPVGERKLVSNPMRPLANLDDLPNADREMSFVYPFIRRDPNMHFIAGRGCPYSCAFCFNTKMLELTGDLGPAIRFRSVGNVVDEIEAARNRWGIKVVYFQDDTFVLRPSWLYPFLEEYGRRLRLPLYCTVRADLVTVEMAKALKDAGCYRVSFGVESGVESIRNLVLEKKLGDDDIRRAADILKRAGIEFQTTNMMGLPGERLEDAIKTIELNVEIGADAAWTSLYQPYPGTELGRVALERGLVSCIPDDERIAGAHTASILEQPDIREIERLHKFVYLAVRFPSLMPTILKLIKTDRPRTYLAIHRLTYLLFYFRKITRMSVARTIEEALVALRHY